MHLWDGWFQRGAVKTERVRAGGHMWLDEDSGLRGDSLGPVMHLHDGASEVFYFLDGRCRVEFGDSAVIAEPGDFLFVPPEVPHNLIKEGRGDLRLMFAVAPNVFDNKWRTEGFRLAGWQGALKPIAVSGPGDLPGDAHLQSRAVWVNGVQMGRAEGGEHLYLILSGTVSYQDPLFSGMLKRGDWVHVVADRPHTLEASGALVLEMTPGAS